MPTLDKHGSVEYRVKLEQLELLETASYPLLHRKSINNAMSWLIANTGMRFVTKSHGARLRVTRIN